MAESKTIAVTGATGQQGSAVTKALVSKGFRVKALTRNPQSERATALRDQGVETVHGDFGKPETLQSAFRGADGAFIMGTPFEGGVEAESEHGIKAVDAAKAAGVKHLVYSSVSDADRKTGVPHFDSKYKVEQHLRTAWTSYTVIAPAYFYDNMLSQFVIPGLKQGTFAQALPPDVKLQCVSTQSIGSFAAYVFEHPELFFGRRVNLAADALNGSEFALALSRVTGREISYFEVGLDQVKAQSEDMALMYDWFKRVGYSVEIDTLKREYPDVQWPDFNEWAQKQDWTEVTQATTAAAT